MTLKTLIELQEKATPGFWQARFLQRVWESARKDPINLFGTGPEQDKVDCEFIAAARNFDFAALDRRMREMEEALRFYADNDKNTRDHVYGRKVPLGWEYDEGEKARKALGS